ncbi:hypothetical protein VIGAN_10152300 [Vigna angularis var. angularis]|uniref:Uncharacterized protein n=1 Tax=Vigna angularis var. angularis TaxID=157739 RepID=A0A0S3T3Z5_PHAAN|nr:hypothetical protein VIGAN_10152300 [Vigna angularis var. angularis]
MTVRSPLDYQVAVIDDEGKSLMFSDGESLSFFFPFFLPYFFINCDEAPQKPKHTPSCCTASWELSDILWRGIFFCLFSFFMFPCFHLRIFKKKNK